MKSCMNARNVALLAACLVGWSGAVLAQATTPVVLELDLDNLVQYFLDTDWSKLASNSAPTPGSPKTFGSVVVLADIVAVNGKPAKGIYINRGMTVFLRPTATPGQATADVVRNGPSEETWEIQQADGTPVGSVMAVGLVSGSPPPGSPSALTTSNNTIVGGTGAYLGARGQTALVRPLSGSPRNASGGEDPSIRRTTGAGKVRAIISLLPMSQPTIVTTATGPAVVHSTDFSPVTAANPAKRGEILSLFATDLGPAVGVDPGKPFPSIPPAPVSSPIDLTVNGTSAEVIGTAGYAGSTNGYQVNFRVPPDAAPGMATLQLSAAWIPGSAVSIMIQ